uniref:Dirigent protein n=1 Tax=Acrobeloides nanus TaxID=290746 RepID=A0A914E080_9BILA
MFSFITLVVLLPTVVFSQTPDQALSATVLPHSPVASLSQAITLIPILLLHFPRVGTLNITGPVYGYDAPSSGGTLALWIGSLQGSIIGSTTISGTSQGTVTEVSLITGTTTSAKALNINGISYLSSNGFHEEVVIAGTLSSALKYSC